MSMNNQGENEGIVYVLTNEAMPGLVKIGKTKRDDLKSRLNELNGTGVPFPFDVFYASKVADAHKVERSLHEAFGPYRPNPKREFFKIEPEQAQAALGIAGGEEITDEVASESKLIDHEGNQAAERYKSRRPNLNFIEMGIPIGAELVCNKTSEIAKVVGAKKVKFNEAEMTLTMATRMTLGLSSDAVIRPVSYWDYDQRSLMDIYEETY